MSLQKKPIIGVLGSNGFLGSALIRTLSKTNHIYIGLNRAIYPDIFDFNHFTDILKLNNVTHLINCIGFNGYEKCASNPVSAFKINTLYPNQLSFYCNLYGIRLIHISSEAIFQSNSNINSDRTAPLPTTLYGQTKLCGEVTGQLTSTIRLPMLTSRYPNNQIISKLLCLVKDNKPIKVSNDVFTTPVIVDDLAGRIIDFTLSTQFQSGIYHASSNVRLSFSEIVRIYADFFDIDTSNVEDVSEDTFENIVQKPKLLGLLSSNKLLTVDFNP
ncbi:MAG: hypothetical protein CBC25_00430 [Pelagibacteraceae bacterium TMED65]|jgi:dTDP-4-dehydrorhamnose reductase|nr:MAG: hypothetical protein CBC25_00430 [Pelagibacteraceae bacterium TMED65]|tara:strand:- start:1538 stop:2353 length:816 start_codon:yes stop_codon:yes gene_type:complete